MAFRPSEVERFQELFDAHKEQIRNFPGCHHLELLRDVEQSNVFSTYSFWEGEEDLDAYRKSALFGQVWPATKKMFARSPEAVSYEQIRKLP